MSNNNSGTSSGIGVTGLLLVAFIVLKLCKVITWLWWWVLAPAWMPIGLGLICLILMFPFYYFKSTREKKRLKEIRQRGITIESKWNKKLREMKEAQENRKK